jgi:hypothetical protein
MESQDEDSVVFWEPNTYNYMHGPLVGHISGVYMEFLPREEMV